MEPLPNINCVFFLLYYKKDNLMEMVLVNLRFLLTTSTHINGSSKTGNNNHHISWLEHLTSIVGHVKLNLCHLSYIKRCEECEGIIAMGGGFSRTYFLQRSIHIELER